MGKYKGNNNVSKHRSPASSIITTPQSSRNRSTSGNSNERGERDGRESRDSRGPSNYRNHHDPPERTFYDDYEDEDDRSYREEPRRSSRIQNVSAPRYPAYPPYYYQGEHMPPPMWPPYFHPSFNYQPNRPNGKFPNRNANAGGYHPFYSMPPPLLPPPFNMFRSRSLDNRHPVEKPHDEEPWKPEDAEEADDQSAPPPGSEAAREKERADIAKRLQEMDSEPASGKKVKNLKTKVKKTVTPVSGEGTTENRCKESTPPPTIKPTKKLKTPKSTSPKKKSEKSLKRSAPVEGNAVSSKKSNISELNDNILTQISGMDREEIRGIVNHPQSAKSQEILKALMNHYRELKGVELDKRRLLAPTTANTSSCNSILSNVDAIEIADLPQEIINQLNNFLGCDLLGKEQEPPEQVLPRTKNELVQEQENGIQENEEEADERTATAMDKFQQRGNDPEKILEELVMIDMRIQADIHRRMELYQQLHQIMVGGSGEENGDNSGSKILQPVADLPLPTPKVTIPAKPHTPLSSKSGPVESDAKSKGTEEKKSKLKTKKSVEGKKSSDEKKSKKKSEGKTKTTSSEPANEKDKSREESVPMSSDYTLAGLEERVDSRLEINIRRYRCEVFDMKVADSTTAIMACSDHNLHGFDINTGSKIAEYKGHVDVVTCVLPVSYWREGVKEHMVCSGGLDEHLCIFGLKSQQCVQRYYVASPVVCLEFFHDLAIGTKMLYAGLKNGMIQMYDIEKFAPKGSLDCGNKAISAILATKEGPLNVLLVAAEDKTICLRDANTGLYLRLYTYNYVATNFVLHGSTFFCQSVSSGVTYFDLNTGQYMGFLKTVCAVSRIAKLKNILFITLVSGNTKVYDMNTKLYLSEIGGRNKLLRYIDVVEDKIVAAARVNDLVIIPFKSTKKYY